MCIICLSSHAHTALTEFAPNVGGVNGGAVAGGLIVAAIVAIVAVALVVSVVVWLLRKRSKKRIAFLK